MTKILFITENFPFPLDTGGRIRTYHILKGLSLENEVTLITTISDRNSNDHIQELQKICQSVHVVRANSKGKLKICFDILNEVFSSEPFVVKRHYSEHVAKMICSHVATHDVVHFDHLDATIYLKYIPSHITTILDEHNIVANQIKTSAEVEKSKIKKIYMNYQFKKTRKYETRVCRDVSKCFVCSEDDNLHLKKISKSNNIITVPNGVDIDFFSEDVSEKSLEHSKKNSPSVIFVGALDYGPGASAINYFYYDIFPLLQKKIPQLKFIVVGQNPPKDMCTISNNDKNFILTGRVDDVRTYMSAANIFVVPLLSGSGTRLKILNSMSMGLPVVSTSIGAEGLEVEHRQNIMIANSPMEFSSAIIELLENNSLSSKLADKGRKLVEKKYSWNVIWESLLDAYRKL